MAKIIWSNKSLTATVGAKAQNNSGVASVTFSYVAINGTTNSLGIGTSAAPTTTTITPNDFSNGTAGTVSNSTKTIYFGTRGQNYCGGKISYQITWGNGGSTSAAIVDDIYVKNAVTAATVTTGGNVWANNAATPTLSNTVQCGGTAYTPATISNSTITSLTAGTGKSGNNIVINKTTSISGSLNVTGTVSWPDNTVGETGITASGTALTTFFNPVTDITVGTAGSIWTNAAGTPTITPSTYCAGTPYQTPKLSNASISNLTSGAGRNGETIVWNSSTNLGASTKNITGTLTWAGATTPATGKFAASDISKTSQTLITFKEAVTGVSITSAGAVWATDAAGTASKAATLGITTYTGATQNITPTLETANTKTKDSTSQTATFTSNTAKVSQISGSAVVKYSFTWSANTIGANAVSTTSSTIAEIKNPVKEVIINNGTQNMYVAKDTTLEISYVINPLVSGTPYSYIVSIDANSTAKNYVSNTTNVASGVPGKLSFNASNTAITAGSNYTLKLVSNQAANAVNSNEIKIYVSPGSQTLYLDWGDNNKLTAGSCWITKVNTTNTNATAINTTSRSGNYSTAYINSAGEFWATANKSGEGVDKYTLNTGAEISVDVTGVTLTLA